MCQAGWGVQCRLFFTIAFKIVGRRRAQATTATLNGLPAARRRRYMARIGSFRRVAVSVAMRRAARDGRAAAADEPAAPEGAAVVVERGQPGRAGDRAAGEGAQLGHLGQAGGGRGRADAGDAGEHARLAVPGVVALEQGEDGLVQGLAFGVQGGAGGEPAGGEPAGGEVGPAVVAVGEREPVGPAGAVAAGGLDVGVSTWASSLALATSMPTNRSAAAAAAAGVWSWGWSMACPSLRIRARVAGRAVRPT